MALKRRAIAKLGTALLWLMPVAVCPAKAPSAHDLAQKIDRHYNHLATLRANFAETYKGMGQTRQEHGVLLLKKPGRMRWTYTGGKVFVVDGKFATGYTPGDPQAQRIPAKQLDDMRSPLRFLLGHTEIEKELDHLSATPVSGKAVLLTGTPRYQLGPKDSENRVQSIRILADAMTGTIRGLQLTEVDGTTTEFQFTDMQENAPAADGDFQFKPPAGVAVVDGLPPV